MMLTELFAGVILCELINI